MVQQKTWKEFRKTGLILFINHFLHIFGWALVLQMDEDEIKNVYPARVKFRGFDNKNTSEAYKQLSVYMKFNASELLKEAVIKDYKKPEIQPHKPKACDHCGKHTVTKDHEEYDGCLGILPGVMNACCGHGNTGKAYIQFLDGYVVKGADAAAILEILRKHKL